MPGECTGIRRLRFSRHLTKRTRLGSRDDQATRLSEESRSQFLRSCFLRALLDHRELLARFVRGHVDKVSQHGKLSTSLRRFVLNAAEIPKGSLQQNLLYDVLWQPEILRLAPSLP